MRRSCDVMMLLPFTMTEAEVEDTSSWETEDDDTPYSKRVEWRDVVPRPQRDGPAPIAAIAYASHCLDLSESRCTHSFKIRM